MTTVNSPAGVAVAFAGAAAKTLFALAEAGFCTRLTSFVGAVVCAIVAFAAGFAVSSGGGAGDSGCASFLCCRLLQSESARANNKRTAASEPHGICQGVDGS